jgi:hypothetical protein
VTCIAAVALSQSARTHLELFHQVLVAVGLHLDHLDLAVVLLGRPLHAGQHQLARPAPVLQGGRVQLKEGMHDTREASGPVLAVPLRACMGWHQQADMCTLCKGAELHSPPRSPSALAAPPAHMVF